MELWGVSMMGVMTIQPPLPMVLAGAVPIGEAASLVEDADGGRAFLRGELIYAWAAGDASLRRLAAVRLVTIKAARVADVPDGVELGRRFDDPSEDYLLTSAIRSNYSDVRPFIDGRHRTKSRQDGQIVLSSRTVSRYGQSFSGHRRSGMPRRSALVCHPGTNLGLCATSP